jgi:hypothetical protein
LVWRCGSWIFGRLLLRFIILWRADDPFAVCSEEGKDSEKWETNFARKGTRCVGFGVIRSDAVQHPKCGTE